MEWWQIGLIILGFTAAGAGTGVLSSYLYRRFIKKSEANPETMAQKQFELAAKGIARQQPEEAETAKQAEAMAQKEAELAAEELAKGEAEEAEEIARQQIEEAETAKEVQAMAQKEVELGAKKIAIEAAKEAEVIEESLKSTADGLFEEVKNNYKIATESSTDEFLPFQTDVWGTHQYEMNKLPANLRDELEQAYTDIRLANSIVWMSTEFSRRSESLDKHYQQLCNNIAERLDKVKTIIEQR